MTKEKTYCMFATARLAGDDGDGGDGGDGGGNQPPEWHGQLPDDLKGNEGLTGFKTIGDLAGNHLEMNGKVSELEGRLGNAILKPGEDASDEDKAAYNKAINEAQGVPESIDGYKFERHEWPEEMGEYPEAVENGFKELCLENNIPPDKAQALYGWYFNNVAEAGNAMQTFSKEAQEKSAEALKEHWGDAFEANCEIAKRGFLQCVDSKEDIEYLEASGLGDNTVLLRMFHNAGLRLLGDSLQRDYVLPGSRSKGKVGVDGKPMLNYNTTKD